jgi:hypothetical protein
MVELTQVEHLTLSPKYPYSKFLKNCKDSSWAVSSMILPSNLKPDSDIELWKNSFTRFLVLLYFVYFKKYQLEKKNTIEIILLWLSLFRLFGHRQLWEKFEERNNFLFLLKNFFERNFCCCHFFAPSCCFGGCVTVNEK